MNAFRAMLVACSVVVGALGAAAQINLSTLTARAVKDAKNTYVIIDSALIATKVGYGMAKTTLTMVMRPGGYSTTALPQPMWTTTDFTAIRSYETPLDSIEISCPFSIPTDFVATNLVLWINGKPDTAKIQDRFLAGAQYQQIVGTRKDPALLEFWGNGSYNLRIFPAKSYQPRKISIEFQHTFDDDTANLVRAVVPFVHDSTNYFSGYYYNGIFPIRYLQAQLSAIDDKSYNFSMPGLGGATFSPWNDALLQKSNVYYLGAGQVVTAGESGESEFMWAGNDKNGHRATGFTTVLSKSKVTLEPDPKTRIIAIDMRALYAACNSFQTLTRVFYDTVTANVKSVPAYTCDSIALWQRAQKLAILSIQQYVAQDQKFNLVIGNAGNAPATTVFPSPVAPTSANLSTAYQAILAARPDHAVSSVKV
ncbi:MAG: hypothetical protein PHC61_14300, partial [Chitinivibrionales bacterium]|nr:hypothetical protein [Chitinivibrionales bacterium]